MKNVTIYHNPVCSKSREALAILDQRGIEREVVNYLEEPPDRVTLARLISASGENPAVFVRTGDREFKDADLALGDDAGVDEVADLLARHPEFLQRPIVVLGRKVVIARPPARLLEIL